MNRNTEDALKVLKAAVIAGGTMVAIGGETVGLFRLGEWCFTDNNKENPNTKKTLIGVASLVAYMPLAITTYVKGMNKATRPLVDLSFNLPDKVDEDTTE